MEKAFREIEPLQKLVERQKSSKPDLTPEVILVDGNGILHERKAGLATFLGVRTGIATIGVGKTIYCTDGLSVDLVEQGVAKNLADFVNYCKSIDNAGTTVGMCIVSNAGIDSRKTKNHNTHIVCKEANKRTLSENIKICSDHCDGFMVPLKGNSGEILAAALVGHGGKIKGRGKKKQVGTKNAIYISVGHKISLQEAVGFCSALSLARIPEPVRQADLIGRDMIKDRK